jgi:hypothetical protein
MCPGEPRGFLKVTMAFKVPDDLREAVSFHFHKHHDIVHTFKDHPEHWTAFINLLRAKQHLKRAAPDLNDRFNFPGIFQVLVTPHCSQGVQIGWTRTSEDDQPGLPQFAYSVIAFHEEDVVHETECYTLNALVATLRCALAFLQ